MSDRYADPGKGGGSSRWAQFAATCITALALPLVLTNCEALLPQQAWNGDWGPLVPHESFPGECSLCHQTDGWDRVKDDFTFDHAAETGFALVGSHEDAMCLRCHNDRGPVEEFASRGCGGCHIDPHRTQLGADCEQCHDEMSWSPNGIIEQHASTELPLMGGHLAAPCEACHPGSDHGEFRGTPALCEICHAGDAARASAPDHLSSGLTSDCGRCHTPFGWQGAGFEHDFFALVGGHAGHACERCHVGGQFAGTSSACFSCHSQDYAAAPGHANYSTQCQDCHDIYSWGSASIDHSFFPLSGGHAVPGCQDCHLPGTYSGLSPTCISCHLSDFNGAPDHVALSFPQDCEQCHSINNWNANFSHDFPLSGPHNRDCTDCHISGTTSTFSCYGTCHKHTVNKCADIHSGVSGYSYSFPACVNCHPNGH